ncbi:MAG: hypothetical protein INR65_14045, partial [Gluconacetobacter diazotrophicus]|nr:hypothetical protein [Gluconacetobacter diazotrophicus]
MTVDGILDSPETLFVDLRADRPDAGTAAAAFGRMLHGLGWRTVAVAEGEAAFVALRAERPGAAVLPATAGTAVIGRAVAAAAATGQPNGIGVLRLVADGAGTVPGEAAALAAQPRWVILGGAGAAAAAARMASNGYRPAGTGRFAGVPSGGSGEEAAMVMERSDAPAGNPAAGTAERETGVADRLVAALQRSEARRLAAERALVRAESRIGEVEADASRRVARARRDLTHLAVLRHRLAVEKA